MVVHNEATLASPLRLTAFVLGALFAVAMIFSTTNVAQAQTQSAPLGKPIEVSGTLTQARGVQPTDLGKEFEGGTFEGVIKNAKVAVEGGQAFLSGTLKGTATAESGATQQIKQQFANMPLGVSGQSCQILFLDVGPIFLDVLGLQVDLSRITLDITAQPGPSNLLGNLLCAVAGLLD
jgi:hypothetical protein